MIEKVSFITQNTFKKLDNFLHNDTDDAFNAVEFINKIDENTFHKLNTCEHDTNGAVKLINIIDEEIINNLDNNNNKPVA